MMSRIGAAGTSGGGAPGTDHGSLTGLGDDDHTSYLLAAGSRVGSTGGAQSFGSNGILTDVIAESTGAAGVMIADNIAVGGATVSSTRLINLNVTDATVREQLGGALTYTGSASGNVIGGAFSVKHQGTHANDSDFIGFTAIAIADRSSGGLINNAVGAQFQVGSFPTQSTGVDNFITVQVVAPLFFGDKPDSSTGVRIANQGNAGVTDVTGLDILSQTAGSGDTYQIKERGTTGFNVLAGDTRIGGTTDPTVALDVTGAALMSSTLGVTGVVTLSDDLDVGGHSAFGLSGIVSSTTVLVVNENFTGSGLFKGADITANRTSSSGSSLNTAGLVGIANWNGSGTATGGSTKGLDFLARHSSSRALALLIGCEASVLTSGAGELTTSI
ncbi:hypothetical protein LCGC14_2900870, partial [marine sediment metagenome]